MQTLIIIPAAFLTAANEAARQMQSANDGTDAGAETFTVPLFSIAAKTDESPTHLWCAVQLSPTNRTVCNALIAQFPGASLHDYDLDAAPGFPRQQLAALVLRTSLSHLP